MDQTIVGNKNTQVGGDYTHVEGDLHQPMSPAPVATYETTRITQYRSALALLESDPIKEPGLFADLTRCGSGEAACEARGYAYAATVEQIEKLDPAEKRQVLQVLNAFIERGKLKRNSQ